MLLMIKTHVMTPGYIKKIIPFFLLAILCTTGHTLAQQFTAHTTLPHKTTIDFGFRKVGDYYYSIQAPDAKVSSDFTVLNESIGFDISGLAFGITLFRYDTALKVVNQQMLFKDKPRSGPFQPLLWSFNDQLYLFYFRQEDKTAPLKLEMATIDPTTLLPGATITLTEIAPQVVRQAGSMSAWNNARITIATSPDQSKVLLTWASNVNNQFFLQAFSRDMQPLWQMAETVAGTAGIREFRACMDNEGKAYLSYLKMTGKDEWIYPLCVYNEQKKIKEVEIKTSERRLYQVLLIPSATEKLIHVTGSYSALPNRITGLFHQGFTTTDLALQKSVLFPFPEPFITQLDKDSWASNKDKNYGLENIGFNGYLLDDGSLGLIGEFRKTQTTVSSGPHMMQRDYAVSGSLVYASLKNGTANFYCIPKYRVSAAKTIGDSYAAVPFKNRLLVFYNDYENNLERDINLPANPSNVYIKSVLAVAYLGDQGAIVRKMVIDQTRDKFLPVGDMAAPLTANKLIFPSYELNGVGRMGKERMLNIVQITE